MTWDAVQDVRRTEAEIVWFDTARLRAPQQRSNAAFWFFPKALF